MKSDRLVSRWRNRADEMGRSHARSRIGVRPSLEDAVLEDRRLLTRVIPVTSPADAGRGTLREAVAKANASKVPVEIQFHVRAADIALTSGQLELSNTAVLIAIVGPGEDQLAVDAHHVSRVFQVDPGVEASISGLTVTAGLTGDAGAGVLNRGDLTLSDVTVSHSTTSNLFAISPAGAGLANYGTATLTGCTFAENEGTQGGGVTNVGTATLRDCTFVDNTATYYGGGMENYAVATLVDCAFVGNASRINDGGGFTGIFTGVSRESASDLVGCSFVDNTSPWSWGGGLALLGAQNGEIVGPMRVVGCTFRGNAAAKGGGVFVDAGGAEATIRGSVIEGNHATDGGGMLFRSGATVERCLIADNTAERGAGVFVIDGSPTLKDCTIRGNAADGDGGGLFNTSAFEYSEPTLIGCTLSGNTAAGSGGGIFNDYGALALTNCTLSGNSAARGGGLYNFDRSDLVACTISDNSATEGGGGIYNIVFPGFPSPAALTDTIVAGNTGPGGSADDIGGPDADQVTGSYNLVGTGGSGGLSAADHNLLGVADPGLAPLGDYGGPTLTMALLPGSPAIHAGIAVPGVTTDQRGFPLDNPVDIGAFQSQPGPPVAHNASDGHGGWVRAPRGRRWS